MTARDPIQIYDRLFRELRQSPVATMESWLAAFTDAELQAHPTLHGEAFDRLAELALATPSPDSRKLGALIRRARKRITGQRRDEAFELFSTEFAQGLREAAAAVASPTSTPLSDLEDVADLERLSLTWTVGEWQGWVNVGIEAVAAQAPLAHLAFAPIRLFPGERLIPQLAAALTEGEAHGFTAARQLRNALVKDLQERADAFSAVPEQDRRLWQLLAAVDPRVIIIPIARAYVERLPHLMSLGEAEAVVEQVCRAVEAVSPANRAQSAFFGWLRRSSTFWTPARHAAWQRCVKREDAEIFRAQPNVDLELKAAIATPWSGDVVSTVAMPEPVRLAAFSQLAELENA